MTPRISSLSRRLLVAALISCLSAAVGIAQPRAEKSTDTIAPSRPSIAASVGVLVSAVEVGSPAEKAGIARGDIILSIDGTAVDAPVALQQTLNGRTAGDTLTVKFLHGDADKTASVTLGTLNGRAWVGLIIAPPSLGVETGRGILKGQGFELSATPVGAYVTSVVAGSPAENAGLKPRDVIQSVDGTTVDATHALGDLIAAKKVGDTVTLSVLPGGANPAKTVKVALGKNPDKDAPYLGVQYIMGAPRGFALGMTGRAAIAGAFVAQVAKDSPAEKAGVQAGDIIIKVAGVAVTDPRQVADAVARQKPGDALVITIRGRGAEKEADVTVTLGKSPSDATKAYLGVSMGATDLLQGGKQLRGGGSFRDENSPRTMITPVQPEGPVDAVSAPTTL